MLILVKGSHTEFNLVNPDGFYHDNSTAHDTDSILIRIIVYLVIVVGFMTLWNLCALEVFFSMFFIGTLQNHDFEELGVFYPDSCATLSIAFCDEF